MLYAGKAHLLAVRYNQPESQTAPLHQWHILFFIALRGNGKQAARTCCNQIIIK